jgi:hypothetical protein
MSPSSLLPSTRLTLQDGPPTERLQQLLVALVYAAVHLALIEQRLADVK